MFRLTPFPHQVEFIRDIISGNVVQAWNSAARGSGKSSAVENIIYAKAGEYLAKGGEYGIWYFTPTLTGTGKHLLGRFRRVLLDDELWPGVTVAEDKQRHIITLDDVSLIMRPIKGRDSGEHEGPAMHFVVIEEAGNKYVYRDLYDSIEPAVSRVGGQIVVIGTPPKSYAENQNGWFANNWRLADEGKQEGWKAYKWSVFDNPVYGGIILPPVESVSDMQVDGLKSLYDYIEQREQLAGSLDEIFRQSIDKKDVQYVYTVLAKGSEDRTEWRNILTATHRKQMEVLYTIRRDVERGMPQEAERKYEGCFLPRVASIGDDELMYIKAHNRTPERYMMDSEGVMARGMGGLAIWEEPQIDETYVVSVDTGGGTGNDFSVALVIRRPNGTRPAKIVAMYRTDTMSADEFGKRAYHLSMMYNFALISVERTGAWGVVALVAIRDKAIDMNTGIWVFDNTSKEPQLLTSREQRPDLWGFSTDKYSNSLMFTTVRQYLRNRLVEIPASEIYEEMLTFNWDTLTGSPDDCLKALAIGLQSMEWVPISKMAFKNEEDEVRELIMSVIESDEEPALWQ